MNSYMHGQSMDETDDIGTEPGLAMNKYEQGQDQDIKWGTMIPLIGGSALGCAKSTGVLPQFHLSYSPFSKNEAHLKKHWPQVPMLYLDQMAGMMDIGQEKIDFINSVCPCAGLSMLNVCKKGQVRNLFLGRPNLN